MLKHRRNEGSTLLLVIAMLSILFLIGAALSFSTRLEAQASANYAELTQARMSAATGLPTAFPLMAMASTGLTSTLQPWYVAPSAWTRAANAGSSNAVGARSNDGTGLQPNSLRNLGIDSEPTPDGGWQDAPQAIFTISDLSSRVNLNTVRSEESLAKLISTVLPSATDARGKASQLIKLRGGDKVSTAASRLDLRRANQTTGTRISSLMALQGRGTKQKGKGLFTEEEVRTLSNYLTVFSESPEVMNLENGSIPKIPLDGLTADKAYASLKLAFPNTDESLLMQFAANLADFSDADDQPTLMNAALQQSQPWKVIFGSEQTPLITEVYPDATSPVTEGDHGQFVEISNPWTKPIQMTGWRLVVGAGRATVVLNQVILPGGTVIVTDNYDQPSQDSKPGTGSFLSIFGARKDEGLRKVQVDEHFDLPDRDNWVSLLNAQGQLIDVFAYNSAGQLDTRISLQRDDPRLRVAHSAEATPFQQSASLGTSKMTEIRTAWKDGNQPLKSAADLFKISSAYVANTTGTANALPNASNAHAWQLPMLTLSPESMNATNLDLRLVDAFTNWSPTQDSETTQTATDTTTRDRSGRARGQVRGKQVGAGTVDPAGHRTADAGNKASKKKSSNEDEPTSTPYAFGKLNVNTCQKSALLGIDVKFASSKASASDLVEKFEAYRLKRIQEKKAPFTNVSEFIGEFFPKLTMEDLPALGDLLDQVTVGSSSFEVVAQNRLSPQDAQATKVTGKLADRLTRRPAVAKARWVVSLDQKPYSLVQYTTVP